MSRGRRDALLGLAGWPITAIAGVAAGAGPGGPTTARAAAARANGMPVASAADIGRHAPFSFGFIGDTPYGGTEATLLQDVFDALPAQELAFMLHIGDIKARMEPFDDAFLAARLALLDRAPLPLVYTPGDNDWADCPVPRGGGWADDMAPGGRLRWLRQHAFGVDRALGRGTLVVERQGRSLAQATANEPRLPENLRWRIGDVRFCTLHVVGSDNGLDARSRHDRRAAFDAWAARQLANARWLADCVALAEQEQAGALAIALHANLRFGRGADDGYRRLRELIAQVADRFRRPILLLHGDTHLYRVGRPLQSLGLDHLLMVECFGSPFGTHWLRIDWDPGAIAAREGPFRITVQST